MATKITYETTCDICQSKTATPEQEYGSVNLALVNVPMTQLQAIKVPDAEATEDGKFFGSFRKTAEVCSVHCARRLLIGLINSLPQSQD